MSIQFCDIVENIVGNIVENIVGKEEIARYEQFLLFPQCFQKQLLSCWCVKMSIYGVKG